MKHLVSCSFGKDSIAMILVMLENNMPIDEIIYCKVMATDNISGEIPEHEEFIYNTAIPYFENLGIKVKIIQADNTYERQFYTKKTRGKFVGTNYGFPMTISAWCNSKLKMAVIDKYFNSQGEHIRYIGIAYDEPKRAARFEANEKSPLFELKIIEAEAKEICKRHGLLSPAYEKFERLGCWFCPKQRLAALKVIFTDYPQFWQMLVDMQKDSGVDFKARCSMFQLDERFKREIERDGGLAPLKQSIGLISP